MYDIEQGLKQMTINIMKKLLPISKSNAALSSHRRRRVVFASLVCQPVLFDLDRERRGVGQRERASEWADADVFGVQAQWEEGRE